MSWRRILSKQIEIFSNTGKPMTLYLVSSTYVQQQGTRDDLFANAQPIPDTNLVAVNIYGRFQETDTETYGDSGLYRSVKGVITIPMLYKTLLAKSAYVDPYLDGSRFKKAGNVVDEGRLFVTQKIQSEYLASKAAVV